MFFINWPRSNLRRAAIRAPAPRQRACSMTSLRETIATPCVAGSLNCTTSITGDQIGLLSGYQAGAGYDLATGLGSVNASNLVNNWNSRGSRSFHDFADIEWRQSCQNRPRDTRECRRSRCLPIHHNQVVTLLWRPRREQGTPVSTF